jgi:hypothetical protein
VGQSFILRLPAAFFKRGGLSDFQDILREQLSCSFMLFGAAHSLLLP